VIAQLREGMNKKWKVEKGLGGRVDMESEGKETGSLGRRVLSFWFG
jgi:hypothetical protein